MSLCGKCSRVCLPLVIPVALALILMAGCGAGAPAVELAVVPDLGGLGVREAMTRLQEAGLEMGEVREDYSNDVPSGAVISTSPTRGEETERGSSVAIITSRGPELLAVPALLGAGEAYATSVLESLGFQVGVVRGYSESIDMGLVYAMEPSPDSIVTPGSRVELTVSLGSAYVTCSNCGGDGVVTATRTCPECGGTGTCFT